ncbi:helix-turn-helix domain-containing protein [Sphingobacterium sp. LRF_L2]|uniref:helix-turn-helix domain-containing protein n=1 Tax=Sphingobacterium sp. LRF_L2 TaxID=3369421 RepID=UPI003F604B69
MSIDKDKFSKKFGQHLKDIREGRKIRTEKVSLRKLEQISEIDFSQIHRIEKGESSPSLLTLKALADALQISLKDLIDF